MLVRRDEGVKCCTSLNKLLSKLDRTFLLRREETTTKKRNKRKVSFIKNSRQNKIARRCWKVSERIRWQDMGRGGWGKRRTMTGGRGEKGNGEIH